MHSSNIIGTIRPTTSTCPSFLTGYLSTIRVLVYSTHVSDRVFVYTTNTCPMFLKGYSSGGRILDLLYNTSMCLRWYHIRQQHEYSPHVLERVFVHSQYEYLLHVLERVFVSRRRIICPIYTKGEYFGDAPIPKCCNCVELSL